MVQIWIIYFVFRCVSLRYGSDVAIGIKQNCFHRFIQNESISHLGSDSNVLRFGPVVYEPSLFWSKFDTNNDTRRFWYFLTICPSNRTRDQSWSQELFLRETVRAPTQETLSKTEIRIITILFQDDISLLWEWIPQVLFMTCIFVYLVFTIIYKWIAWDSLQSGIYPSWWIFAISSWSNQLFPFTYHSEIMHYPTLPFICPRRIRIDQPWLFI